MFQNILSRPAGDLSAGRETVVDLVAFPGAGAGSAGYLGWREALPPDWRFTVACSPGRELSYGHPFATNMDRLADDVAAELRAYRKADDGVPLVLLGHSMGGLLAQLVAQRITVNALVVASCPPPAVRALLDDGRTLDHEELRLEVAKIIQALLPMEPGILDELVELSTPILAADIELLATYRAPATPVSCDIWALYGSDDILEPLAWVDDTTGAAHVRMLPGSHFFVQQSPETVVAELRECLAPIVGGTV